MTNINTKKIEGTVQEVTKDSVKLQNYWIHFFDLKELEGIKEGDTIGILYVENTKNNRLYRNGKSIVKYEQPTKVNIQLDTTIQNTLVMTSRDIYVYRKSDGEDVTFQQVLKEVIKAYMEELK